MCRWISFSRLGLHQTHRLRYVVRSRLQFGYYGRFTRRRLQWDYAWCTVGYWSQNWRRLQGISLKYWCEITKKVRLQGWPLGVIGVAGGLQLKSLLGCYLLHRRGATAAITKRLLIFDEYYYLNSLLGCTFCCVQPLTNAPIVLRVGG